MKTTYFTIENCEYELIDGKPAIIAPEGIDEERLKEYTFIQLLDGRWCHYMTDAEKAYYKAQNDTGALTFSQQNMLPYQQKYDRKRKIDFYITFTLILLLLIGIVFLFIDFKIGSIVITVGFWGIFISTLFHNKSAEKVLIAIVVIVPILFLAFIIYVMYRVDKELKFETCDSTSKAGDKACDTAEDIGEIGAHYIYYWE